MGLPHFCKGKFVTFIIRAYIFHVNQHYVDLLFSIDNYCILMYNICIAVAIYQVSTIDRKAERYG